jgi:hypothetical protein
MVDGKLHLVLRLNALNGAHSLKPEKVVAYPGLKTGLVAMLLQTPGSAGALVPGAGLAGKYVIQRPAGRYPVLGVGASSIHVAKTIVFLLVPAEFNDTLFYADSFFNHKYPSPVGRGRGPNPLPFSSLQKKTIYDLRYLHQSGQGFSFPPR